MGERACALIVLPELNRLARKGEITAVYLKLTTDLQVIFPVREK